MACKYLGDNKCRLEEYIYDISEVEGRVREGGWAYIECPNCLSKPEYMKNARKEYEKEQARREEKEKKRFMEQRRKEKEERIRLERKAEERRKRIREGNEIEIDRVGIEDIKEMSVDEMMNLLRQMREQQYKARREW